jgi:hypothetical protein
MPDREAKAYTSGAVAGNDPQILKEWLDAVTEPRFMTALASVAMEPGVTAKSMNRPIDPALVRNWAEFVDPHLYLRWMASAWIPSSIRPSSSSRPSSTWLPMCS